MSTTTAAHSRSPLKHKHGTLRFVVLFGLILAAFYGITATPWFRNAFFPTYLEWNAGTAAFILRSIGEQARAYGTLIVSPNGALAIKRGCDSVEPAALLFAAIMAFPASWRSRLLGALIGVSILLALNIVRIVSLYYVQAWYPEAFQTIHVDVWQPIFVVLVVVIWSLWAWRVTRSQRKADTDAHR